VLKPCLGCGEPTNGSRCADCQLPRTQPADRPSATQRGYDSRWQALSKRLRKRSPFCEWPGCGSTTNLTVDHIIPLSEDPALRLEPLNCRVLCRTHNTQRHNRCTDDERRMVREAIAARKRRRTAI
jgi:5-methylcytosine-specific restriction endonuclease McrA